MQGICPRLLVTTPPKSDETLSGYLVRLSALNHYEKPAWILSMAGIPTKYIREKWPFFMFCPATELKRLNELLALDLPDLESLRYPPTETALRDSGDHLFFGVPVPRYVIQPQSPKVCPECLKESQHCRRIWDFKFVTCCPIHQRLLVDRCSDCGERLKWYRRAVSVCDCGFDLRRAPGTFMNDAASRLCNMFCRACGLPDVPEGEDTRCDNPLTALNLEHLVAAVLFISSRTIAHGSMAGRGLAFLGNRETHDLLLRTASIFEGWPDRFYDFLERERSGRHDQSRAMLSGQFGQFYQQLFAHARLSHANLDFFRLGFAAYLELCEEGHWVKKVKLNLKYLTRGAVEKRLGVSWRTVRRLISAGKLKTVTRKGWQGERILVELESVEKLREELARLLGTKEVANYLGVSADLVLDLATAGVLRAVRGPNIDGYRNLKFDRRDVENLKRSITGRLPEYEPLFERCLDLRTDVERFGQAKLGPIRNVWAILNVKPTPRRRPSLGRRLIPMIESPCLPF